jgi:hypothetical protein
MKGRISVLVRKSSAFCPLSKKSARWDSLISKIILDDEIIILIIFNNYHRAVFIHKMELNS